MLSKWMAHDLAAKIIAAEAAPSDDQVQRDCARAILELWEHRAVFPHEKRPFERYESILRTLERLDPELTQPFYLPEAIGPTKGEGPWLNAAISFDKTARIMITYVLDQAAAHAEEGVDWDALASAAKIPAAPDLAALRRLLTGPGREALDSDATERKRLKALLSELATFQKISRQIVHALKAELENLDHPSAPDSGIAT
ncbi:hypothetical protein CA606_12185 [Caulobacter vibrioides]|uniref:Uncharacterized protein n=2 Tax=Caulobacter vibrioides TaxID=155892 RepID=A0A290N0G2_CAUVI|nr:hypothetical protein CA606_12185 [Caulobacter vibrioides]